MTAVTSNARPARTARSTPVAVLREHGFELAVAASTMLFAILAVIIGVLAIRG